MPEPLPYPPLENYIPPRNPAERLHDELHYGGEGKQLRERWVCELDTIHGTTEFAKSFAKIASLSVRVRAEFALVGAGRSTEISEIASYMRAQRIGCLAALHTMTPSILSKSIRQAVRNTDLWSEDIGSMDELSAGLKLLAEYDARHESFDIQSKSIKTALSTAAEKLYSDYPAEHGDACRDDFIFGYLSAGGRIVDLVQTQYNSTHESQ